MQDFDIHTHSIASGHGTTDTIADLAKAAFVRGLKMLGISDHAPATPGAAKASYFRSLSYAPKMRCGIQLLYGAELNILSEYGTVDLPDDILSGLDYAIASLHTAACRPGSIMANTNAYIHAMDNPYVKIIGHADDASFPTDYDELVAAAKEKDVLLELNNTSLLPDSYRKNARENCILLLSHCQKYNHKIILTSGSHGRSHLANFACAENLLNEVNFPERLVIRTSEQILNLIH